MATRTVNRGFMLVELLIALMIASMVSGVAYAVSAVYQRHNRNQQLMVTTQQNLSGAMVVIEQMVRMAGYDPQESGQFGIVDVRRYDLEIANQVNSHGQPALFYTLDRNGDGELEGGPRARNGEHLSFRIQQAKDNGPIYLSHDNGSGRRPLADRIEAMGMAYALDADNDGMLDTWTGGTHLIWAVDSDNDNLLDTNLDTNNDGQITIDDDLNADGRIDAQDGASLRTQVTLDRIKAIRIWLLAVSDAPMKGLCEQDRYLVGDRILSSNGDNRLRRLLESTIYFRNL